MWDNAHMNLERLRSEIRERMKARGITAKRLSRAAGRGETYVRDLMQGRTHNPTIEGLRRLADVLGCTVAELTGEAAATIGSSASALFVSIHADEIEQFAEVSARVAEMLREEQMPHDQRTIARLTLEVWRDVLAAEQMLPLESRVMQALTARRTIVQQARTAMFRRQT
jgi:transcriptional regulator with XRE-family HTH domain